MNKRMTVVLSSVLATGLAAVTASAYADEDYHEMARRLQESGQVMPLTQVLEQVQASHPGRLLEAGLDDDDGQIRYEIKLLGPDGKVSELKVNAANGEVIKIEED